MRFRIAVSTVLIGSVLWAGTPEATQASALALLIQKARSLEGRDRADLAAQVWQQVLISDPNQVDALTALIRWARHSGKNNEANVLSEKLRQINPNALATLDVAPDPARSQSARLNEAAKLAASQKYDAAMQIYQDVFGNNPPPGGWALAYYETQSQTAGGMERAIAALKKLATDYPEVKDYPAILGRLLTYRPATRQEGINLLASVAGSGSTGNNSKQAWKQALVWERNNPAYISAMQTYLTRFPDPDLQTALDALVADRTSHEKSRTGVEEQKGYEALRHSDLAHADEEFNAALAINSRNERALAGLGYTRMKEGNFSGAAEAFEKAKAISPKMSGFSEAFETAKFWSSMQNGTHALQAHDVNAALENFRKALAMRKDSPDALRALAGVYMQEGQSSTALPYLESLTQADSRNGENWQQLGRATYLAQGAKAAQAVLKTIPQPVADELAAKPEFSLLKAQVAVDNGDKRLASLLIDQLSQLGPDGLSADQKVTLANLMIATDRASAAEKSMRHLAEAHPENLGAWSALMNALVAEGKTDVAESVLSSMPVNVPRSAAQDSGFLLLQASLYAKSGDTQEARRVLQQVLAMPEATIKPQMRSAAELQLASVLIDTGEQEQAHALVEEAIARSPEDAGTWKQSLLVLQKAKQPRDIVDLLSRIPEKVISFLQSDGDVVWIFASAEVQAGHPENGIRLMQRFISQAEEKRSAMPVRYAIQLCWLLLESHGHTDDLYRNLQHLSSRTDLESAQSAEIKKIWTIWIGRTAETAVAQGDLPRAEAVLAQGVASFPESVSLQSALAGTYLKGKDTKRAFNAYANWGLKNAAASDYAGAVGSALSQGDTKYADAWLEAGLKQWPVDSQLLTMAGDRARSKGDLKTAKTLWRDALVAKHTSAAPATASADPAPSSLRALLVGDGGAVPDNGSRPQRNAVDPAYDTAARDEYSTSTNGMSSNPKVHLSNFALNPAPAQDFAAPASERIVTSEAPASSRYLAPKPVEMASNLVPASPAQDSLEDKLAGLENRNSPFLNAGTTVQGRSGQAGFDRLLIEEANFEASTTIADQLRISLLAKPTFLDGGTADKNSTVSLGTAPVGSTFKTQTASGVAGEAQLSTQDFGVRLGSSANGFLVRNFIGGVRWQPGNGPLSFLIDRDDVKDTLLSYAGTHDPISGQTFGGVVATGGSLNGHWGTDLSGFYTSIGYHSLTGKQVADNSSINGNFGVYWKAFSSPAGNLTLGLNFSALHYEKNLRYFTLGQGGYFSPQQYYLFGIPFRYAGTYKSRLQYSVSGSLGLQHFEENDSPYFPLNASLQMASGNMYPAYASTGANFSFDGRINYQINPQLFLGFFVSANNARNYVTSSAGLSVTYSFDPKPESLDHPVSSVPDWKGQQPFSLF
jgi:Tfp pilus assembly protein PilF